MPSEHPPTLDPTAALRWGRRSQDASAWLHEEVARRMAERLQWIRMHPRSWVDWEPVCGGLAAHATIAQHYPRAKCFVVEPEPQRAMVAQRTLRKPWWSASRWAAEPTIFALPGIAAVQMVWANMALHMSAEPRALIEQWHRCLEPEGFLMFSCLGPDTLRELRALYQRLDWPPPAHEFTDMHDWGDMLVNAGFAEPVMDMERIKLSFETGDRLLCELRQLGRNLHPARFAALRGRRWRDQLLNSLAALAVSEGQRAPIELSFEIIYGHALKARPRLTLQGETVLSLDEMRGVLQRRKRAPASQP